MTHSMEITDEHRARISEWAHVFYDTFTTYFEMSKERTKELSDLMKIPEDDVVGVIFMEAFRRVLGED